jgi:ABC-type bacteriocin/lantibiotic exporter with double-glycine peptidase domain
MSLLELITVAIIVCLLIPFAPTILLIMVLIVCSPIIAILKVLEIIIDPLVDRQMKREREKKDCFNRRNNKIKTGMRS